MTYESATKARVIKWLWAAVVFGAFAIALMWFIWDPFAGKTRVSPEDQTVPSAEWTTAPESEHVEVDLPDTPMTNVPEDGSSEDHGEGVKPD